ncbi:MAG: helix-turn-helix transcriptional regulator [Chloroflexota bacterium]
MNLIEAIAVRQAEAGWSDGQVAERLRVSRSMWQAVRTGGRMPGRRFLEGVAKGFPELGAYTLFFLGRPVAKRTLGRGQVTPHTPARD